MATFKATIGTTLSTVTTSLDAVNKTINTAILGIDMAHSWVKLESEKQSEAHKHERALVRKEAKHNALVRISDMNIEAANYINRSQAHAASYKAAEEELVALLAD